MLTLLVMFLRPDFLNLTICMMGLFLMFNLDRVSRGKFRVLVLGVVLSMVYDGLWFYLKHSEYMADESKNDGSAETNLRKFSLTISYASFFFRVSTSLNDLINGCVVPGGDSAMEGQRGFR